MIFEFPVVRFPENPPVANMQDYDQFRGYLADKGTFRWSYGSVKGRPQADWQTKTCEAAIHVFDRNVDVGNANHECHRFVVDLGD